MLGSKLKSFEDELHLRRGEVIDNLLDFFMTDMMFFWGEEKGLIEKQTELWAPLLKWAEEEFDAKFVLAKGIDVPEQDMQSGYRVRFFIDNLSDRELTVFYFATNIMQSVLLAAAFVKKRINAEQAFKASMLEEVWQQSVWGSDARIKSRHNEVKNEINELESFLNG